jgi:hypothetical protein
MKSTCALICILIFVVLPPVYALELQGGVSANAMNGEIKGTATPTTNLIYVGDDMIQDSISPGEGVDFSAMVLDDDIQLGVVESSRSYYSEPDPQPSAGGDPNSYKLLPWTWKNSNPMQLYVKASEMPSEISIDEFAQAVTNAALTWEGQGNVWKNLFYDPNEFPAKKTVLIAPDDAEAIANDGKFVHSFTYSSSRWIAQNRIFYDKITGELEDADVRYNTRYKWTTDWDTATNDLKYTDLETIALHELGHNIGLDDIYNDPNLNWDTQQIMNYYSHPQHWLGLADIAGVQKKYNEDLSRGPPPVFDVSYVQPRSYIDPSTYGLK